MLPQGLGRAITAKLALPFDTADPGMTDTVFRNGAKRKLEAGEPVLCLGLRQARSADMPMIAAAAGFDCIYVDMEHGPASLETCSTLCIGALAAGITPLVRVPGHDVNMASRALDGGAQGVIFPHVGTAAEASRLAAACRFPPLGHRSVIGPGPALAYRTLPLGKANAVGNAETLLIVMLETPSGIANAEAIAATEGVDVLLIGANDLSTEMGIPGEWRHPRLHEAFVAAAAACRKHGRVLGIGGISGDLALQRELYRMGANFIIAGSDTGYLMSAARADVSALRRMMTEV